MNPRSHLIAFSLLLASASVAAFGQQPSAPKVKEATVGETRNVHVCGKLFLAGQPGENDMQAIKEKGIKRVITLRTAGEVDWDEAKAVKSAGLQFVEIPFRAPDSLTDEVFDRVRKLLQDPKETPTMLHCGSANRVGAVWLAHRVLDQGVPLETAAQEAKTIGLRSAPYEELARDYVSKRLKGIAASEKSVRPGINTGFLNPRMNVKDWIARFEGESREIYRSRFEILDTMGLKPGMRAVDVGAGTGFFSFAMADRVGADQGWIYAVDISPRFVEHVGAIAAKSQVKNLSPVLCAEDSIRLPADSVDVVFICDTYHHFEFPKTTLASILHALKPNGSLVVIDFERIPGKSREFIISHVRADKAAFRGEIEAAGFQFVNEVKIKGLVENYCLKFRKPSQTK